MLAAGTDAPRSSVTRPVTDAMDTACAFSGGRLMESSSTTSRLVAEMTALTILQFITLTPHVRGFAVGYGWPLNLAAPNNPDHPRPVPVTSPFEIRAGINYTPNRF